MTGQNKGPNTARCCFSMKKSKNKNTSPKQTTFASMAQAATAMGVGVDMLKLAKRSGSPGFAGNGRVNIALVQQWIDAHSKQVDEHRETLSLRDQKLVEEIARLRIANEERRGELISRAWIAEALRKYIAVVVDILDNRLVNEAPPLIVPHEDVPNARIQIRRFVDQAKMECRKMATMLQD